MKKIILTAIIVISGTVLFAQPQPPTGGNAGNGGPVGGGAPIDGGFSILIAMGAFYGAKKVYHFKKID